MTSVVTAISAAIIVILEADTSIEQAVLGSTSRTMSATPSAYLSWGPGNFYQFANGVVDKRNELNIRIVGSEEEVNTAMEEITTVFFGNPNFTELRTAGVLRIELLNSDPPINWQKSGMTIGDIQFLIEARFTY